MRPFDLTLPGPALPSPAMRAITGVLSITSRTGLFTNKQTVQDIMNTDTLNGSFSRLILNASPEQQSILRQQLFLSSFIDDAYGTTGRGDAVYLAAWTDESPLNLLRQRRIPLREALHRRWAVAVHATDVGDDLCIRAKP